MKIHPAMQMALLLILAGCASPTKPPPKKFIFFPGPPDQPRLQFLTSFNSEKDLTGGGSGFAEFITGQKPTDYTLGKPYGIALYQKKFYVCDSVLHGIVVLDLAKRQINPLPTPEEGALAEPLNITIDTDGVRYITDDVRDQVICLDAQDQFKWILGKKDEMKPRDVAVSSSRIFVADIQGHCVRAYDKTTRQLLFTIPKEDEATNLNAHLFLPTNLALDAKGQLYVSDSGAGRVQVYDSAGHYVRSLGGYGDDPQMGTLKRPKGVALDREGHVYVVDAVYQLVQVFDSNGQYLMWFGYPGDTPAALILPAKVIVDYDHVGLFEKYASPDFKLDHLVIVTSQFGNRKVSIYGFGRKNNILPLMVVAALVLVGCTTTAKRKWLTVFFDGVPDVNASTNVVSKSSGTNLPAAQTKPVADAPPAAPLPPPIPQHKPYLDNNCEACHESRFSVGMRAPLKDVCLTCHKTLLPVAPQSVHTPVDSGECLSCHNPHYSTNKFLLVNSGKAVCADCHDPELAHPKSSHEPYENWECLSCHNAHASVNKHLVTQTGAKLCFQCHDDFLEKAKFKHTPADNGECDSCHNPHASMNNALLIKDGNKLCEDCHEPKDVAAAKGHANVGKATCLDCHDPHIGNDEYLLRPNKVAAKKAP